MKLTEKRAEREKMDRVLYAKYNSMRKPAYRLTTEIHEGGDGRWVVKKAGDPAARPHMDRIAANRALAEKAYQDITVLDVKREKSRLVFPFVAGTSLSSRIDTDRLDKERFVKQVNGLFDRVLTVREACKSFFKATEAFVSLFGDQYIEGVPAICPANIDSIFSNFIETEDGLVCLDYEWVYDFPVPVDYIRYRVLFHLYNEWEHSLLDGIRREELMEWFGLDEEKQAVYWNMESRFQQEIHGEKWKYHYLEKYKLKKLSLQSMNEENQRQRGIIQDKENHIANLEQNNKDQEAAIAGLQQNKKDQEKAIAGLQGALAELQRSTTEVILAKDVHIANLEHQYDEITHAFFWRITSPFRKAVTGVKNYSQKHPKLLLCLRTMKAGLRHGPVKMKEVWREDSRQIEIEENPPGWPTREETARQKEEVFDRDIRFSILVPLYNTPKEYLMAMIQSVRNQTYGNWELCRADGSDEAHGYVKKICRRMARKDRRIRYRKLEKNLGISGNTNACIEMATGDYIGLFDHDDVLHPSALYEDMKVICAEDADFIYTDENTFHETPADAYWPHYKPDFAPDTLRSYNYICHFTVFAASLLEEAGGGFRSEMDGSQDYDLILRLTEKARHIVHIPKVLYYWRSHAQSVASDVAAKPYTMEAARKALAEHLERIGLKGEVLNSTIPSTYKIQYEIVGEPLISIVIPTMDHVDDLKKCVESIREKSTWKNWEIVIVENNSKEEETFRYYKELEKDERIRIVTWEKGFNFSGICNFGAAEAKGDYILLLNNDIEIITPDWLEQMLMFAQRTDVGAVGAMLYYPDDTIQHAGVILGIGGVGGHSHKCFKRGEYGYASRLTIAQNLTGVTAACVLIPKEVWEDVQGLDEGFAVAFNDVDLCMRIRKAGYLIVWTPYAEMYHYESKSRGLEDSPEKQERFNGEVQRFLNRWGEELKAGDPYYNPNLTLVREDFSFAETERV